MAGWFDSHFDGQPAAASCNSQPSRHAFLGRPPEVFRSASTLFRATCARIAFMCPAPTKQLIDTKLIEQIDVRVGMIEAVREIEGSDKLMALDVNFGDHRRTIVAGIRQERANPLEIEGRQALFVLNMPPRKMKGVTSEGMLFDIGYADGITPVLAVPERPVPNGTRAG